MGRKNNRAEVYLVRFRSHSQVKTASVVAVSLKRAESLAESFPNVIGISKAQKVYDRIMNKELVTFTDKIMADIAQPKMSPLAMDEFIWLRRNKRIENRDKDKLDK
jgi:hypothetical protein